MNQDEWEESTIKSMTEIALDAVDPLSTQIETNWINVNGREEHEEMLRDSKRMHALGLDPAYEKMVYLRRWGSWLNGCENYSGVLDEKITCKKR
jgi:hypothetical protein